MNLLSLDIPDEVSALPQWLEAHLIGHELGQLAAELSAVAGPARERSRLDDILGGHRQQVLEEGLRVLPPAVLQRLLQQPELLLELQEAILLEGGDYWNTRTPASAELRSRLLRHWAGIEQKLTRQTGNTTQLAEPAPPATRRAPNVVISCVLTALATAALLLIAASATGLFTSSDPPPVAAKSGWGWMAEDALPQNLAADEYFDRLAKGADAWFNKRPADEQALAQRIAEFRQGCSLLIFAKHAPLSDKDRTWLVNECRQWALQLDSSLAALEAGDKDAAAVQSEVDLLISDMRKELESRAETLRSA